MSDTFSNNRNPPEYVTYDDKAREEFLSQHGSFAPEERDAFHKICRSWEEQIPFPRIDEYLTRGSLIEKLRTARLGVVITQFKDGQRKPKGLVLSEEGGLIFYKTLLEEEYVGLQESIANPLPTEKVLSDTDLAIPESHITDTSFEGLVERVGGMAKDVSAIYRLDLGGGERLLLPSSRVKSALALAIARLKYHFQSANLMSEVARILNSSVMEIKSQIESKEMARWKQICDAVSENRGDLEQRKGLAVDEHFFTSAQFARRYIEGQIAHSKKQREQQTAQSDDIAAIEEKVRMAPTFFVDPPTVFSWLDEYESEYGEQYPKFREAFFEDATTAKERRSLPQVLLVGNRYIHRNNVFPAFKNDFEALKQTLRSEYLDVMKNYLRGIKHEGERVFASEQSFEEDIARRVSDANEFVSELLEKPAILAEALIHNAKKKRSVKSIDDLKIVMADYFQVGTMKLKDISYVFGLSMLELFDTAFRDSAILRQIWLKITGRAETLRDAFARLTSQVYGNPKNRLGGGKQFSSDRHVAVEPKVAGDGAAASGSVSAYGPRTASQNVSTKRGSTRPAPNSREKSTGAKKGKRDRPKGKQPVIIKQKKPYNEKERNEAWDNFKKTLSE